MWHRLELSLHLLHFVLGSSHAKQRLISTNNQNDNNNLNI